MKNFKFLFALAASVVITGFATSCSKDDDEGAKTISYVGYEVKDFTMYIGGQAVNNHNAMEYFKNEISRHEDNYSMTFDGNNVTYIEQEERSTYPYEFRDGKLWINYEGSWYDESMYGNKNQLSYRTSFIKCSEEVAANVFDVGTHFEEGYSDLNRAMSKATTFSVLRDMGATDTLMWCNVDYIYK